MTIQRNIKPEETDLKEIVQFGNKTIAFSLELAWRDWLIEKITNHVARIPTGDFETLSRVYAEGYSLHG